MASMDIEVISSKSTLVNRPKEFGSNILKPLIDFIVFIFMDCIFLINIIYLSPQPIIEK